MVSLDLSNDFPMPQGWHGGKTEAEMFNNARAVKPLVLTDARLRFAKMPRAYLINAEMRGADLAGADLSESTIIAADFSGANITDTNLLHASVIFAEMPNGYNRESLQNPMIRNGTAH